MIKMKQGVSGLYRVEVLRPDGSVKDTGFFPNLITDGGMAQLTSELRSFFNGCHVGAGTTPPQTSDTQLQALAMSVSGTGTLTSGKQLSDAPFYAWRQHVYTFAAATANVTLGEVGIGPATSLRSRALLRDQSGNITTVTVLIGEILRITYVMRLYFDMNKYEGSFIAEGVTYNYVGYAVRLGDGGLWQIASTNLGADATGTSFERFPSTSVWGGVGTTSQAVTGTSTRQGITPATTVTAPGVQSIVANANLSQANFTDGINYLSVGGAQSSFNSGAAYGFLLDKYLPKTSAKTLSVTYEMVYVRHTP